MMFEIYSKIFKSCVWHGWYGTNCMGHGKLEQGENAKNFQLAKSPNKEEARSYKLHRLVWYANSLVYQVQVRFLASFLSSLAFILTRSNKTLRWDWKRFAEAFAETGIQHVGSGIGDWRDWRVEVPGMLQRVKLPPRDFLMFLGASSPDLTDTHIFDANTTSTNASKNSRHPQHLKCWFRSLISNL